MTKRLPARLVIDLAMTVLLLFALAYRIIGDIAHEWVGVSLCVLFIAHNIINRRWWMGVFRGRYTPRRIVMTAVNVLLALAMTTLIVTGFLHSRTVLAFLHLEGGAMLRQIHTTAAYWGLILIAVHAELHGGMFTRRLQGKKCVTIFARSIAALIVIFGVWSFIDRDMFAKLFLGFSFDYWNEERSAALFFVETLGIMAVFAIAVCYAMKLADRNGKGR
ncbi:MAG: DUF4405 domain-containing protein [Treponematales bacterium]